MAKLIIKNICSVFISLAMIFSIIVIGEYVSVKVIKKNEFFLAHIQEIKSDDNILDKVMIFLEKDSIDLFRKYLEAVMDSIIKFEQLPSFSDIKNFFGLVLNSAENNVVIDKFEIKNNNIVLTCKFFNEYNIAQFVENVQKMEYIDKIFYDKYTITDNKYQVKISCIHNN